jgi:hypothetical protein
MTSPVNSSLTASNPFLSKQQRPQSAHAAMLPQLIFLQALQQQYRQQTEQPLLAQWPQQQQQRVLVCCLAACGVLQVQWLVLQGSCSALSSLPWETQGC